MTPEQKIKRQIVMEATGAETYEHLMTGDEVDAAYADLRDKGKHYDVLYEVREGEYQTDIEAPYSRHYESRSVAAKCCDGSYVGWTYWYGGGKHSEPEAVDWMDEAYNLTVAEEQKMVTVQTWQKTA